jgi:hypothetical protein
VEKTDPPASRQTKLEGADGGSAVCAFAEEGFWYDSFAGATKTLAGAPDDEVALMQRATLLEQVGLKGISEQIQH